MGSTPQLVAGDVPVLRRAAVRCSRLAPVLLASVLPFVLAACSDETAAPETAARATRAATDPATQAVPDPATKAAPAAAVAPGPREPALAGRVLLPGGAAAGAGLRVIAWPADAPPALADFDPARGASALRSSALTDASGAFRIDGLPPDTTWTVLAAGPGLYTTGEVSRTPIRTGDLDLAVPVSRLVGVAISVRDEEGARLLTHAELVGRGPGFTAQQRGAILVPSRLPALALAAPLPPVGRTVPRDDQWMLLAVPPAGAPGGLLVKGEIAGYAPFERVLQPDAADDGVTATEIRLARTCAGFSRLTVRLLGTGPAIDAAETPPPGYCRLDLELRRPGDPPGQRPFSLPLNTLPWEDVTFDGIPQGTWHARLRSWHGLLGVPPADEPPLVLEIGPELYRLELPVPALGAVALQVQRADGSAWTGRAHFQLEAEALDGATGGGAGGAGAASNGATASDAAGDTTIGFETAPYILEGLPPGRYRLVQTLPFAAAPDGDGGSAADGRVTIEPGRLARVRLQAAR